MKTSVKWILCCTGLCILGSPAFAQANYGSTASQPASQSQQFLHAKDLIGKDAKDARDKDLGEIHDVLFNPHNGESFAAIDVGSGRYALVPWQALTVTGTESRGKERVTLNTTKEALRSGPTVSSDQWGTLSDPSFTQRIYSQYNLQPPGAVGGTGAGTLGGSSSGANKP